ncbi:MAG TPA: MFS transporter [Acidimicrobiales bacterium]|nr:MFS transporter [Acidimicrobiales bacterium]
MTREKVEPTQMSSGMVMLFAMATALSVANLYYIQPLLRSVEQTFHVGSVSTGLVVTYTQIGYVCGLVLLVPLGDLLDRRKLIVSLLAVGFAGLILAGLSESLTWLSATVAVVGMSSVVAQILVPFAATLASEAERGKVVGTVMSGLLVGILLARTFSGLVAGVAGWRSIYFVAAALMVLLGLVLWRKLPSAEPAEKVRYSKLLRSVLEIFLTEPVLRLRSAYGAASFAMFSILWTSLAFLLAGPDYRFSNSVIGLFGLAGAGGAVAASFAGRSVDSGRETGATMVSIVSATVGFGLLFAARQHLWAVIAGIVILDIGCQGLHVTNQAIIYRIRPEARSRITTAYMVTFFVGGTIGSAASAAIYGAYGWAGVCILGTSVGFLTLLAWLTGQVQTIRSGRTDSSNSFSVR